MNHTCYSIDERPLKIEFTLQYRQKVSDFNKKNKPITKSLDKKMIQPDKQNLEKKSFKTKINAKWNQIQSN